MPSSLQLKKNGQDLTWFLAAVCGVLPYPKK